MLHLLARCALACSLVTAAYSQTPAADPPHREPKYPLKTMRTLVTDAEIARARENVRKHPEARKLRDGILKVADPWLAWEDRDLITLITPASIPRAFNEGTAGCPKCGKRIYEVGGTYPWIIDPKVPFKLKCPVDGSVYPSNDYDAYYKSGFTKKVGWDTEFVDDGWGWVGPNGERYWFVAHWNHELWHKFIGPGVGALGRAYLLTGDARYAHKAAVMLYRIAEVYPAMDHERQSRYGTMMAARGIVYSGKVLNRIWETNLAAGLAEAYDSVWETIDADTALQAAVGRSGEHVRASIEANLLEDAIDAYFQEKILGNFGMHQAALVTLALVRQHGEREKFLDDVMGASGGPFARLGLRYALYNHIDRNGIPPESAPGYNSLWTGKFTALARLLNKAGRDLHAIPKTRSLYDGTLDIVNIGRFTPSLGDSGSVYGDPAFDTVSVFESAALRYRDPRYAGALEEGRRAGAGRFSSFESLFDPPAPTGKRLSPQRARLLDGTGYGILSNPADTVSLTLSYGLKAGHGHFDRLGFEMFALGQPIMPDLGYPDAMNDFVPGIYTWSKNTISHNTVTVDASRQSGNLSGRVALFADSPFARVIDVSADGTYPKTSAYRRAMVMVDTGRDSSYFVDVFTVAGGKQHDYSLHGPPGAFEVRGGTWTEPAKGTLAGEDVPEGVIYDNARMGAEGYTGGYGSYAGSGFQHFVNVRRHTGGAWVAEWAHERDSAARLRVRVLDQPGQEVRLAEARVSPVKYPQHITYVLARRAGETADGRFVSVMEPYKGAPIVADARLLPLDSGAGVVVAVRRGDLTDVVLVDETGSRKKLAAHSLSTDARAAVVTLDRAARPVRAFFAGGTALTVAGRTFTAADAPSGAVVSVDPPARAVRVRLEKPMDAHAAKSLAGRVVHFQNGLRRTAHPVASARIEGGDLVFTTSDDLLIGLLRLKGGNSESVRTDTPMAFAPAYIGAYMADPAYSTFLPVRDLTGGSVYFAGTRPDDSPLREGVDAWMVNVGPGDRLDAPPVFAWTRPK